MRPRTLLLVSLVVLVGAVAAVSPALAAPSKVKLEVNQNCVDPEWPCWTAEPSASRPQPDLKFSITEGGEVEFADHDPTTETSVVWTGGPTTPSCPGVPTTTIVSKGWEGTCTFTQPGTYMFKSLNMFNGPKSGPYGDEDYTEYEVVVTGPPTPTTTTEQATAVTETEATLNGRVDPEGQATSYYFEYGTTESYGTKTSEMPAGSGSTNQEFHFTWTGLSPNTTYDFQLVAVYGTSRTKVEGGNTTFKTAAPPGPPSATTGQASVLGETAATLTGAVDPDGQMTSYLFQWGTSDSYGHSTSELPAGSDHSSHTETAALSELQAGTVYHFRIVAKNQTETVTGADETFTTASPPPNTPSPITSPIGGNPIAIASTTPPAPSQGATSGPPVTPPTTLSTEKATKPLTRAQKLATALKQCKKQPKKKRAQCETNARKLYAPQHKSHKK